MAAPKPASSAAEAGAADTLKLTPLHSLHQSLGAKMVPFAGYDMPVQYAMGVMGEHKQTRTAAGLFDVSHMGQVVLEGPDHGTVAAALEKLVPGDIAALKPGRMRYSLLLKDDGGILDDTMITRLAKDGQVFLVLNASRKDVDLAHLRAHLPDGITVDYRDTAALLALQGPKAAAVLASLCPEIEALRFLQAVEAKVDGVPALITRSGYTGEDGFEISVPGDAAEQVARKLLDAPDVEPIGLGARDSLRLEAGLCLYGNDIDETTTPVAADLTFTIGKRRRSEGGFPGADRILAELDKGTARRRVGLLPEGKVVARAGSEFADKDGKVIGTVTSGSFGPTLEGPVAMGYVDAAYAEPGTDIAFLVRGQPRPGRVAATPFVPHNYVR